MKWLRNQKVLSYKNIINILKFILNKQLHLHLTIVELEQVCIDLEEFKKSMSFKTIKNDQNSLVIIKKSKFYISINKVNTKKKYQCY